MKTPLAVQPRFLMYPRWYRREMHNRWWSFLPRVTRTLLKLLQWLAA